MNYEKLTYILLSNLESLEEKHAKLSKDFDNLLRLNDDNLVLLMKACDCKDEQLKDKLLLEVINKLINKQNKYPICQYMH